MFGKWFSKAKRQTKNNGSVSIGELCHVSKSIVENGGVGYEDGTILDCVRHSPLIPQDSGWEIYKAIDMKDAFSDSPDMSKYTACRFKEICKVEPELEKIFDKPVGSHYRMFRIGKGVLLWNVETGETIE